MANQPPQIEELIVNYKFLPMYTHPVKSPERKILGRETEMRRILAAFARPELCNIILLGEAGSGKTAIVQGLKIVDQNRYYLELDIARMIAELGNENELAAAMKSLFDEISDFHKTNAYDKDIVLFIDEFHQVAQISASAVEVLKPLLADSGTRGIRVIAASTYAEFRLYILPNQALVERLQRVNLSEPTKQQVIDILKNYAARYKVQAVINPQVYDAIYEYTNRYIPANAQPRKSILILDNMIGWYRAYNCPLDIKLLCDVIYDTEGINVAFRVDALRIGERLRSKILAQDFAIDVIEQRLQICVADLNDKTKPMSSLLFCGSTGTGKTETAKQLAQILFEDERRLIRFDMTEYANTDSLERFRKELTTRVWERPYSVILLDEIEKSCAPVTRLLLQVLDDGRLLDENNRVVSFANSYIIITTNAGNEIYNLIGQYASSDSGFGNNVQKYERIIYNSLMQTAQDNKFPPELLGRIDCIVPFQPLSENTMRELTRRRLSRICDDIRKRYNIQVLCQEDVIDYLVGDVMDIDDSDRGGARMVMSKIEREIVSALSRRINENRMVTRLFVVVTGETRTKNKNKLRSDAQIEVLTAAPKQKLNRQVYR